MALSDKNRARLTAAIFIIFIATLVYNVMRDPRSLYDPDEKDWRDKRLEEQKNKRNRTITEEPKPILKTYLLDTSPAKYQNIGSRNIFDYGEAEPIIRPDQQPEEEVKPVQNPEPVDENPKSRISPYRYIGFAELKGRKIAFIEHISSGIISIVHQGEMLGSAYQIKSIDRKTVILLETTTQYEFELKINE